MSIFSKIFRTINKIFTLSTGIILASIGVIFIYHGSCSIDEIFVQILIMLLGLAFLACGLYYYFKAKQKMGSKNK